MALKCIARYRNPLFLLEFIEPARANRVGVALEAGELLYGLEDACAERLMLASPCSFEEVADGTRGYTPTDHEMAGRLRGTDGARQRG